MYSDHDHGGEYADLRHDHDNDYAPLHHRHYDLEKEDDRLRDAIREWGETLGELRCELQAALERIRALEGQMPQARQLQLEADQAAADLAESGYDRHGRDCGCAYCSYDEEELEESPLARRDAGIGTWSGHDVTERRPQQEEDQ